MLQCIRTTFHAKWIILLWMDSSQILLILSQELPGPSAFLQLCICSYLKVYEIRIGFA